MERCEGSHPTWLFYAEACSFVDLAEGGGVFCADGWGSGWVCGLVFVCWSLVNRVGNRVTHPTLGGFGGSLRGVLVRREWCEGSHPT